MTTGIKSCSAYLVENARLFGLTHREQMLTAVIAGWHNGPSAKYVRNRHYSEFLDENDWQKARKLSLILALAESLDATQMHLAKCVSTSHDQSSAYLDVLIEDRQENQVNIEIKAAAALRKWFKKEFGKELVLRPHVSTIKES